MDVLVVDDGARGHALTWKAAQSPECDRLWVTSDTPGVLAIAKPALGLDGNLIPPTDVTALHDFALRNKIGLTVVGQEDPLNLGIVDLFQEAKLPIFGPTQAAAELETSKLFAADLTEELGIPTAKRAVKATAAAVASYIEQEGLPAVIKADGLAQGKGVKKCFTLAEVDSALRELTANGHFGKHGQSVVIEEYLEGPEISLHAWCDGKTYRMFPFAMQDHKTIYENDEGSMTGGMGVIAPVPGITAEDIELLGRKFVAPVLNALKDMGWPFKGALYPGLILTRQGPKLLEYNVRPGGPETEAWTPLLQSDLLPIARACFEGKLAELPEIKWRRAASACIVLAAKGYPLLAEKGAVIEGLGRVSKLTYAGIEVFHGGTKRRPDGKIVVNGGRVASVVAVNGERVAMEDVIARGLAAADLISFEGRQMRRDIGLRALSGEFEEYVNVMRETLSA